MRRFSEKGFRRSPDAIKTKLQRWKKAENADTSQSQMISPSDAADVKTAEADEGEAREVS
eukprot:CAMPEP_0174948890 /NCGR_PEP_ID=MMETSP1355-20121228/90202_1 /TAXON_ID=464990 /ORGANISM="Hemiselmis tepida, Strain CCMP443" /LENGTH=59 /DNA_ID=CAMNT_0016196431 /DNA_START=21 /DNA_END=197 /DNA_ORIENTATION=-